MRADAHNAALVQHHDLFGMHDGGNALCHDEHGGAFGVALQCLAQLCVCFEIQRGEGVVKDVNRRFLYQRAGDGKTLALSARNIGAALTDGGFKAVRQLVDEFRGLGHLGGPASSPP